MLNENLKRLHLFFLSVFIICTQEHHCEGEYQEGYTCINIYSASKGRIHPGADEQYEGDDAEEKSDHKIQFIQSLEHRLLLKENDI